MKLIRYRKMKTILAGLLLLTPSFALAQVPVSTSAIDIVVTPTIETTAYADNDVIGELMTLSSAVRCDRANVCPRAGRIVSVKVEDTDEEDAALTVYFFKSNISNSTVTDNAAFVYADEDIGEFICKVEIDSSYEDLGEVAVNVGGDANTPRKCTFSLSSGTSIYAVVTANGSTPTYTAGSYLTFTFSIDRK